MKKPCRLAKIGVLTLGLVAATTWIQSGPPVEPPPPECDDFVTGGGWITGTPSGQNGNFGVHGGIQNGELWGHLNYVDHATGMHVVSTAVTGYFVMVGDPLCRVIDFEVTIDGVPGTAEVIVCDHGEPGRLDSFTIFLSNGYEAGGDLGETMDGGGNIQLHRQNCN
ncbi:MAG: hypothetical protein HY735_12745 [Verrucomicrobia bacterium]|nr:hypothetical protein [Verrucomicrobiota bacterium]